MPNDKISALSNQIVESTPVDDRFRAATEVVRILSDPGYGSGLIHTAVGGGLVDELSSGCATGIFKAPSSGGILGAYPRIDWAALGRALDVGPPDERPYRFIHLAQVVDATFRRRTFPNQHLTDSPFHLVHLNTYQKVPLYSEARSHGVLVDTLPTYGFPAAYCSLVDEQAGLGKTLSSCSRDIVIARAQQYLDYNRGVMYEFAPRDGALFYIDRKANIRYQNWFIRRALEDTRTSQISPSAEAVEEYAREIGRFVSDWWRSAPHERLGVAVETARQLRFSIIGYCLFETIHEFVTDRIDSEIREANGILIDLDPRLGGHWSMRAFAPTSASDVGRVLTEAIRKRPVLGEAGELLAAFARYFNAVFFYKVKAFIGDVHEDIAECAFNSRFFEAVHSVETTHGGTDLRFDGASDSLAAELCGLGMGWKKVGQHLRYPSVATSLGLIDESLPLLTTEALRNELLVLKKRQSLKLACRLYLESIGANTLKVMLQQEIGPVGIPFQPDIRGELLLTPVPRVADNAPRATLVRIGLVEPFQVIEERGRRGNGAPRRLDAPVLVRNFSRCEPKAHEFYEEFYACEPESHRETYERLFRSIKERVSRRFESLESIGGTAQLIAVVVPFFKEKRSFVDIVSDTLEAFRHRTEHVVFVLVGERMKVRNSGHVSV